MAEATTGWNEATNGAASNADDAGWNTISEEDKIDLEHEGDGFIGTLVRMDPPTANGIVQIHLENVTDLDGNFQSERAFINGTRDLVNKMRTVPLRRQVRAQWTSSQNTGQISPMRVFSVAWR